MLITVIKSGSIFLQKSSLSEQNLCMETMKFSNCDIKELIAIEFKL